MRTFLFSITVVVSVVVFGGCASSYVLSPDDLAAQLRAGQKSESAALASTVTTQIPNHGIGGSVEKLLCTDQSGNSIWVYPNTNTEFRITKKSGELATLYFDTVLLEDTKLIGVSSRVQKTQREVNLSDIQKIELYLVNSRTEPAGPH